jgi:glutaminase
MNARRIIFTVSFIMTIGPIINAGAIIHRNFKNSDYAKKKLNFFVQYPGTLGTELWKSWIEKGLVKE